MRRGLLAGRSTAATLRHLWPFVKPENRRLLAACLVTAGLTVVEVAPPWSSVSPWTAC